MKHRVRSHSFRFATTVALAASACAGFVSVAGSASADEYSVQIGAFESPEPSFAEAAEKIGKLYETRSPTGLTRIQVGRYASLEEANVALRALAGAGYADAYVVNKSARLDAAAREARTRTGSTVSTRGDDPNILANVPAELRERTVLLDGRLHVIEGNRFIPLREYLAGSR